MLGVFLGTGRSHGLLATGPPFPKHLLACRIPWEVGCGSVAMVTSLLLRRLLLSSVATFTAPSLQYFNWLRVLNEAKWKLGKVKTKPMQWLH